MKPTSERPKSLWTWLRTPSRWLAPLTERFNPLPPEVNEPPGGLGIAGLPGAVGQLPCGVPVALLANDTESYQVWMEALLHDAVLAGPVCWLADSTRWVDHCLRNPVLAQAYDRGRLLVWMLTPDLNTQVQRKGLTSLVKDLAQVGFGPQHALLVMPANRLFRGLHAQALQQLGEQLQHWCQRRARPMVFCLKPGAPAQSDALARTVRSMTHVFLHVATLGQHGGRRSLYLERWEGESGAFFDACYGLKPFEAVPRLVYDGSLTVGKVPQLVEAPDQLDVFTTASVVRGIRGVPAHWKVLPDDAGLLPAAANAMAATVLVDAGQVEDFGDKARLIHQLRQTRPRTLRILVRETHGKLRVHFEQALLRLGANEVIYREVSFPRLLQMLQESPRTSFTKDIPEHPDAVLVGAVPVPVHGYQSARRFVALVREMLDSAQRQGVSSSYVQLHLLPRVPHLDALTAIRIARDGDLMTTDENALHVFLFACPEPDLEQSLERMFTCPLSLLFVSQVVSFTDASMRNILKKLENKARHGLPDYTEALSMLTPTDPDPRNAMNPTDAPDATDAGAAAEEGATKVLGVPFNTSHYPMPAQQHITVHARPIGQRGRPLGGKA